MFRVRRIGRSVFISRRSPAPIVHRRPSSGARTPSKRILPRNVSEPYSISSNINGAQLPQQTDLLDVYRGLVAMGRIRYDEDQVRVVMQLRRLSRVLQDYTPPAFASQYYQSSRPSESNTESESDAGERRDNSSKPWYSAARSGVEEHKQYAVVRMRSLPEELAGLRTPKGLLLTGPPGCGKSFLVDLWLSTLPTPFKTRKHYNELVLEIYRGVWEETKRRTVLLYSEEERRQSQESEVARRPAWTKVVRAHWRKLLGSGALPTSWRSASYSLALTDNPHSQSQPPIAFSIAHRLVTQHWLLVFDELQFLDVSSAGLLADVLSWFWRMGGIIIASSNKVPDDLYRGGVQRERLEPFVEALKIRCPVLVLRGEGDWRRERAREGDRSFWFSADRESEFWSCVTELTEDSSFSRRELNVFGRRIVVPHAMVDVCRFTFSELCDESLGPADYITIAAHYRTVIITEIPILRVSAKNQSRRFISLIDALYEARCRIVALAEDEPDKLFFPDAVAADSASNHDDEMHDDQLMAEAISESRELFRPNVSSYEERPERPVASPLSLESLYIFSGEEERFAYRRALSRLIEMTSDQYARDDDWRPLSATDRKWERVGSGSNQSGHRLIGVREAIGANTAPGDELHGDFAAEGSYEAEAQLQRVIRERPSAPRLSENHVWGAREDWGERAGSWGKGASAFDDSSKTKKKSTGSGEIY